MRKDIAQQFGHLYEPFKALLICRNPVKKDIYVQSFDFDPNGRPINAHPLSLQESMAFARALDTSEDLQTGFLDPVGLLPKNVLYINRGHNAFVLWQTPAQKVRLLFKDTLSIPSGEANIPPMIWKAQRGTLQVYALYADTPAELHTNLYKTPYFNVYEDGKVCLGTVSIQIPKDCCLEAFIRLWETYFFNSFFSHTLGGGSPVKGNIVQLWQSLVNTGEPFPLDKLIPIKLTLKDLIK
ncbi:PRTRC system protein B [Mucilaginibacter lappiensis]|uniref:PRTRC genetic system protein B n=1 Tax=Mucilaginibacter lappiensis TaxID=354630 RepID=A0ABR6PDA8_9SPHI|nr:PRTRC system protein B [Mucilaginibacter lappiensis]MBB6107741.1 PRTRC genetic system protein B [Mucilaginibacter lappiensis]SIP98570.1 PRTRC system protein B [Mucilaginibacter lappiensis]